MGTAGRIAVYVSVMWLAAAMPGWAQAPASTGSAPPSQKISLDLKGVDILDVLKLLSQKSGLNFVAGRNVTGRVTIFVSDVEVWEAFERLVAANDLAYEQYGNIVTVMLARDYELVAFVFPVVARAHADAVPCRRHGLLELECARSG